MLLAEIYFFEEKDYHIHIQLIKFLFENGYKIKEEDVLYVVSLFKNEKIKNRDLFYKWSVLRFATKLNDFKKLNIAILKSSELFTLQSFKKGKPVYFNLPNLLTVSINAIQHYREDGDIILKAMDIFGVRTMIENLDKRKGTFQRKKKEYLENKPIQNQDFEEIAIIIFPELAKQK